MECTFYSVFNLIFDTGRETPNFKANAANSFVGMCEVGTLGEGNKIKNLFLGVNWEGIMTQFK